jgi:hypothetical protein
MNMYGWLGMAFALAIILGVPGVLAFFVVRAVRRDGVRGAGRTLIRGLGRLIKGIFEVIAAVLTGIGRAATWLMGVGSGAAAKDAESREKEANEPWDLPGGSYYNYRTGRFDSGRDPAGRYVGLLGPNSMSPNTDE